MPGRRRICPSPDRARLPLPRHHAADRRVCRGDAGPRTRANSCRCSCRSMSSPTGGRSLLHNQSGLRLKLRLRLLRGVMLTSVPYQLVGAPRAGADLGRAARPARAGPRDPVPDRVVERATGRGPGLAITDPSPRLTGRFSPIEVLRSAGRGRFRSSTGRSSAQVEAPEIVGGSEPSAAIEREGSRSGSARSAPYPPSRAHITTASMSRPRRRGGGRPARPRRWRHRPTAPAALPGAASARRSPHSPSPPPCPCAAGPPTRPGARPVPTTARSRRRRSRPAPGSPVDQCTRIRARSARSASVVARATAYGWGSTAVTLGGSPGGQLAAAPTRDPRRRMEEIVDCVAEAFAAVPRTGYLRAQDRGQAAYDGPIAIGAGQTNSQPRTVADMLRLF